MSQQPPSQPPQPPYQPPAYGAPTPPPSRPQKPRPRALWFVVGGLLLVLAVAVFVVALLSVLRPLTQEDAVFAASETPYQVDLPADVERTVFSTDGYAADCTATDGSGAEVDFRPVAGEFTYNAWTAVSRFDTGDGEVTFECAEAAPGQQIRIAQTPSTGGFVAGLLIGILGPMVLGLAGVVVLIVTGVLWATRPPRSRAGA